jgi:hypothetical protein
MTDYRISSHAQLTLGDSELASEYASDVQCWRALHPALSEGTTLTEAIDARVVTGQSEITMRTS